MKNKAKVFLLDDDVLITTMLSRALKKEGYRVRSETHTNNILQKIRSWSPDLLLLDIRLPEKNGIKILEEIVDAGLTVRVVMLTADDTAETAVKAMKIGAADYLTKPFNMEEVKIVLEKVLETEKLKREVGYLRELCSNKFQKTLLGESLPIKELISEIQQISKAGVSMVLVTGESGTGKEIVARQLHQGMFKEGYAPFIRVNCAALPENLLETELFGYRKGAFTDAKTDKKGLFEQADGGCLLLDEIGEIKLDLQSKLLRALEERRVRPVGGKEEVSIDVSVIATTNKDLNNEVKEGHFRLDLFYRLNTFHLHIVPLRERTEDILVLARYFLSYFSDKYNKKSLQGISPEAEELMISYNWPGNVRELRNMLERIVVLKNTDVILLEHLPAEILNRNIKNDTPESNKFQLPESGFSLEETQKDIILQALEKANYNKTLAAKLLNISYDTLRYKIKKYGFD